MRDTERHASITDFLQFLVKMTKEASDSVFGLAAQHVTKSADTPKSKPTQGKCSSFAVETQPKADVKPVDNTNKIVVVRCALCSKDHIMSKCPDFKKQAPLKRLETARDKRVCFNCLKRSKHSAKF